MTTYYNTAFMLPGSCPFMGNGVATYQKIQASEAEIEEYKEEVVMMSLFYRLPVPAWSRPSALGVLMASLPSQEDFEAAYVQSTQRPS